MDARLPFYIGYIPDALSQVYHNGGGIARLSNDIPLHPGDFRATACGCHHRMDPRADTIGDDGALPDDLRIDQHGVHLPVKMRKDLHRERRIQPTNVGDREIVRFYMCIVQEPQIGHICRNLVDPFVDVLGREHHLIILRHDAVVPLDRQ